MTLSSSTVAPANSPRSLMRLFFRIPIMFLGDCSLVILLRLLFGLFLPETRGTPIRTIRYLTHLLLLRALHNCPLPAYPLKTNTLKHTLTTTPLLSASLLSFTSNWWCLETAGRAPRGAAAAGTAAGGDDDFLWVNLIPA